MCKVESYDDMMALLFSYIKDALEVQALRSTLSGVRSPNLSDTTRSAPLPKDSQYNRTLERIDALERRINYINACVDSLKDVNEDYFRIIYHKWLVDYPEGHPSLEYIAENILYMDRSTFFRLELYKQAKDALLSVMRKMRLRETE